MRWCWAIALAGTLAACGPEEESRSAVERFETPQFDDLADPAWSPTAGPDDPVLATVGEARITLSAVQRQVDLGHGDLDGATALQHLVESELLSQEALRHELERDPSVLRESHHEAVRRLLYDKFIEAFGPEDVARQDIDQAFRVPQVRSRFDHEDGYFVRDVQIVCCSGAAAECRANADPACFDMGTPIIQAAYEELSPQQPFADAEAFVAAAKSLQARFPQISVKTLSFWYRHGVPYNEQRGYTLYFPDWVQAIVDIQGPGYIAPPLRSYHAWHIPMLDRHVPAVHKTPDDPEVRREISEGIITAIRRRDFQIWKLELMKKYRVELHPEPLQALAPSAKATPEAPE